MKMRIGTFNFFFKRKTLFSGTKVVKNQGVNGNDGIVYLVFYII